MTIATDAADLIIDSIPDLDKEEWQEDFQDPDCEQQSIYLGSVFNIMPSGKYYMPFACSNVAPCDRCEGQGTAINPDYDHGKDHCLTIIIGVFRNIAPKYFGHWSEWPEPLKNISNEMNEVQHYYNQRIECPTCGGFGSEEAYKDDQWTEAANEAAEKYDAYITGGEGDPCDIYLCRSREKEVECT
jgi:hypothetical protein